MKILLLNLALVLTIFTVKAQVVNIPDTNFKAALIAHVPIIDSNGDGEIQISEAIGFTDTLNVNSKDIYDLIGIEEFTNIKYLDCGSNNLSALNISGLTGLIYLNCESNNIYVLDVSTNTVLANLYYTNNHISSIDLSNNAALIRLDCGRNYIDSLNVSANTELTTLNCFSNNNITTIDLSNNTELTYLNCSYCHFTDPLDFSNNTALSILYCNNSYITSLDLSANTELTLLDCRSNSIISLDLSANIMLETLDCNSNDLTSLNVSNNTVLTTLICRFNNLPSIDVSNNTNLSYFICEGNEITSIDLSANTALTTLLIGGNQLTSLDVSNNTALTYLACQGDDLTSLDVSNNTALTDLICGNCQLTSLDVNNNTALINLGCYSNFITNIDLSNNLELEYLGCNDNQLTGIDVSNNLKLDGFRCNDNQLTGIDVSNNHELIFLECYNNQLTYLDIKNGNNINNTTFKAYNNPNLNCIQVDDAIYSTNNWTDIDATATFAEYCLYDIEYPNIINGNIFLDDNCLVDTISHGFENIILRTEPEHYYGLTDSEGTYTISTDSGTYKLRQLLTLPLVVPNCPMPNYHTVIFDSLAQDTSNINFFNKVIECPLLSIDLSSDRRRRCFTSNTYINFFNTGYADASGVEVTVKFPEFVKLVSADYPYTINTFGNYVFNIGDLEIGGEGTIHIIDSVACIADITNLTQCTKAWITPPNDCADSLDTASFNAWDKSSVMVSGECINDSIISFTISNTSNLGEGDMETSQEYRIYSDNALVYTEPFQLNGGQSITINYPADGHTIRFEADQHPNHTGDSNPQETIEACGDDAGVVSTGYVNNMPMDDNNENIEIDCMTIIDSYDPNDKTVSPQGVSYQNYLAAGTVLDYQIRFQNTGSDTAYTVIVIDTLSAYLNPYTIQWGISSHPYTVDISGMGTPILRFTFNNIDLPDSTTNELESHGFVKFKVATYDSLENGIQVNNTAHIFFDYNTAIVTNTAQFTISDTVLIGTAYTIVEESIKMPEFNIYPNPTTGKIKVESDKIIEQIVITDINGRIIKQIILNDVHCTIDLSQEAKGIYFIKLIGEIGVSTQKLILE